MLALALPAAAQDFNLDVGAATGNPIPAATFGGAAARPGAWSIARVVVGTPTPLSDITGAPTAVTITMSGGTNYGAFQNLTTAPIDDFNLMSDIQNVGPGPKTWTVEGLAAGEYDVYTYAMAPNSTVYLTNVSVAGSADPLQTVGGAWPNGYVQGITHALHRVTASSGVPVVITVEIAGSPPGPSPNFGSVNGFQVVRVDGHGNAFCFGDGVDVSPTTACPCANLGAAGNGCANSVNAAGANLAATGAPTTDDVVLVGSGMPATVACIYLQGDALDDAVFGDGVRCTGGTLLRLRTKINVAGASSFPDSVETVTLSQRGGVTPGSGVVRYYQTYYRNSAPLFCPPATFNVTNGWQVTW